jgi:hypothetical protein
MNTQSAPIPKPATEKEQSWSADEELFRYDPLAELIEQGFKTDDAKGLEVHTYASKPTAPNKQKRVRLNPRPRTASKARVCKLITDKAATPGGFASRDALPGNTKNAYKVACDMCKLGLLVSARVGKAMRHFTTQAGADAWEKAERQEWLLRHRDRRPASERPPRVRQVKIAKVEPAQSLILRKPWAAPVPRIAAEVVHTARTRYMIIPTPAPRNTTYSTTFQHGAMRSMHP